jgi:hypothetical protein
MLVVTSLVSTVIVISTASYCVGRRIDPETRFLEPDRPPTLNEAVVAFAVEYALQSDEANDVIFLGDSTCAFDIDPVLFGRLTGLRAYNLGTMGVIGPTAYRITLQAYLAHHPKPRLVVLCLFPFVGEIEVLYRFGDVAPRFIENYGPEVADAVPFHTGILYFIKRGGASLRTTRDCRSEVLTYRESETYYSLKQKVFAGRGFQRLPGEHGEAKEIARPGPPKLVREEWDQGVRRIAEECEKAGVPLLIRFTPVPESFTDARDFSQLERWTSSLQKAYPTTVRVVPPVPLTSYPPPLVYDNVHLNSAGVAQFMPLLAKEVQTALAVKR